MSFKLIATAAVALSIAGNIAFAGDAGQHGGSGRGSGYWACRRPDRPAKPPAYLARAGARYSPWI
jgi:hypothetical protein